jgi:hypothetical protein
MATSSCLSENSGEGITISLMEASFRQPPGQILGIRMGG